MMLDHISEKQEVEVSASCSVELLELSVGEHARHQWPGFHVAHRHVGAAHHHSGMAIRDGQLAIAEPLLHGPDLILLCVDDS